MLVAAVPLAGVHRTWTDPKLMTARMALGFVTGFAEVFIGGLRMVVGA